MVTDTLPPSPADSGVTARTVVITRPAGHAAELAAALGAQGLASFEFPLIEIAPVADAAPLLAALAALERYALVIFVSPNAVDQALARRTEAWPAAVPIGVVGPGSLKALARHGIAAPQYRLVFPGAASAAVGENGDGDDSGAAGSDAAESADDTLRYDSEALLAEIKLMRGLLPATGARVLLVRGDGGREFLADGLRALGAEVAVVAAYRRLLPEPTPDQWRRVHALLADAAHVWLLTSSEGVRNLEELAREHLNPAEIAALKRAPLVAPHARIAETARALGFVSITVSGAGDAKVVRALLSSADQLVFSSMTDSKDSQPIPPQPAPGVPPNVPFTPYEAQPPRRGGRQGWLAVWLAILVVALAAGGGGYVLNRKFERVQQQAAQRQQALDAQALAASVKNQQALDAVHQVDEKMSQLAGKVDDTRSQQQALEQLYQNLARNGNDWTLAEIEQMLSTASQQLQLTGNVPLALFALQSADARLAAADGPQMLAVRKAIEQDIEKLKAAPTVDLAGLAIKLDEAIAQVDALPLSGEVPAAPTAATPASAQTSQAAQGDPAGTPRWKVLWHELSTAVVQELSSLVQVRRLDRAGVDAMLVAPQQEYLLRANLKLRLLSARLSLLSRDESTLRSDLHAADDALGRYFDPASKTTQTVRGLVQQVQQAATNVQLPTLDTSLKAVHQYKSRS
jgi:uroporphyrinogen III methyltransferase/synthase